MREGVPVGRFGQPEDVALAADYFLDDRAGSIEKGKYADLAVWDTDIYDAPVANVKDMKCLMTLVGGAAPEAAQGRDLFGDREAPTALYGEEDHEGNVLESIRTADWKLIVANADNHRGLAPIELYDMRRDPGETKNLAAEQPDRVAELKAQLEGLKLFSARSAVSGETGELDAATEEKLRALGYIE